MKKIIEVRAAIDARHSINDIEHIADAVRHYWLKEAKKSYEQFKNSS